MATEITMPKLSDTMEEGTILKWRVQEGDQVSQGDIIAEVETDKAAMEMEAFEAGVVRSLEVEEGQTVSVGTVIAILEAETEKAEKPPEVKEAEESKPAERAAPKKEKPEAEKPESKRKTAEASPEKAPQKKEEPPKPEAEKKQPASAEAPPRKEEPAPLLDFVASPAARELAREKNLDLARVRGTGPGGRVVRKDVETFLEERTASESPRGGEGRSERSVKMRRIVAKKMVESWQSIPHFFVTVAVNMEDALRMRKEQGVTINDLITKGVARSLLEHPWVNSHWIDGEPRQQEQVNIALAVATDEGLYNPVIHDCGNLSLKEISRRAREIGERAREGKLKPQDMEEGTFTISNMGMLGVESFSAIITPPQAAVLAVGTVRGEAVVNESGEPAVAPMVRLTLSADHRTMDGADAADFMATLKSYLEAPMTLIQNGLGKEGG